jgi:hypothetical protein
MKPSIAIALLGLALAAPAAAQPPVPTVEIASTRVTLADLVPSVGAALGAVDLGAAPPPGGSRLVTRDELAKAAADAGAPRSLRLPASVRVVRRMRKLSAAETEKLVRDALVGPALPRGVTIAAVRAPARLDVADGWDAVVAEVPKPPKRTGSLPTTALLTFSKGAEVLARASVPVDLALSAEAAVSDVARGAPLTLVIRRGLVEITASGLAGADADVGATLPVTVRPSGRVLRAKLVEKDRAELVDGN